MCKIKDNIEIAKHEAERNLFNLYDSISDSLEARENEYVDNGDALYDEMVDNGL